MKDAERIRMVEELTEDQMHMGPHNTLSSRPANVLSNIEAVPNFIFYAFLSPLQS